MSQIDPRHSQKKEGLKTLGFALVIVGGTFSAIGLIDFFAAFGEGGMPDMFWMAFIGLPMLGGGLKLLGVGFLGEIGRYSAGELGPVVKDTIDYVKTGQEVTCASCGHENEASARFCDQCGAAMGVTCTSCGTHNDPDSKFCDSCGKELVPKLTQP